MSLDSSSTTPIALSTNCLFNGFPVADNAEIEAYQTPQATADGQCAVEKRVCKDGVFSGSFAFPTCIGANGTPSTISANDITTSVTLNVPADYPTLIAAKAYLDSKNIVGGAIVTIKIADGNYVVPDQFIVNNPQYGNVKILGNQSDLSKVILNFDATNNKNAFIAMDGGRIGLVDGLSINCVGARIGRSDWNLQAYGAGIQATGSGSQIRVGSNIHINNCYYGELADNGSSIFNDNGVEVNNSGDVNFLARFNSHITCLSCRGITASHITLDQFGGTVVLGFNFLAESSASMYVDGSYGADAQVAGFAAQTSASMWAHLVHAENGQSYGGLVKQNGYIEFSHAHFNNNSGGILVSGGSGANIDGVETAFNKFDGIGADTNSTVEGSGALSHDNGGFGFKATKKSVIYSYGSAAASTQNAAGSSFAEAPDSTVDLN